MRPKEFQTIFGDIFENPITGICVFVMGAGFLAALLVGSPHHGDHWTASTAASHHSTSHICAVVAHWAFYVLVANSVLEAIRNKLIRKEIKELTTYKESLIRRRKVKHEIERLERDLEVGKYGR